MVRSRTVAKAGLEKGDLAIYWGLGTIRGGRGGGKGIGRAARRLLRSNPFVRKWWCTSGHAQGVCMGWSL